MALKTLGVKKIKVKKETNILFFSTGNEISNTEKIHKWKVRNSNSLYLESLKKNFLFKFQNGGILKDHHKDIFKFKIKKMFKSKTDMIIDTDCLSWKV